MVEIVWAGLASTSIERCRVTESGTGVHVTGTVDDDYGACSYEVRADVDWQFRSLTLSLADRTLEVRFDDETWTVDGQVRPDLAEAREVDLAVSPFSNTLPLRRLRLAVGDSADIVTAYITVPELAITADPQRYTRVSQNEYLYESRDSDFSRTLSVDEAGLVIDYPGLFERRRSSG